MKEDNTHYDKITEDKISSEKKDVEKQYIGDTKICPRQTDKFSGITSENSNISKSMYARKPTKPLPLSPRRSSVTTSSSSIQSTLSIATLKRQRNATKSYIFENQSNVSYVIDPDDNVLQNVLEATTL